MKYLDFLKNKNIKKIFEAYDNDDYANDEWVQPSPKKIKKEKEKPEKEIKKFNVGDELVLVDNKKSNKLPEDAYDFLITFKTFKVLKVSETGKLDLGCHISKNTPEGGVEKIYMFSPNRFELKNSIIKKEKDTTEEDISPEEKLRREILDY